MSELEQIDKRALAMYESLVLEGIPINPQKAETLLNENRAKLNQILQEINQVEGFIPNPNKGEDWQKIASKYNVTLPRTSRGPKTDVWTVKRYKDKIPTLTKLSEAKSFIRTISLLESVYKKALANFKTRGQNRIYPEYRIEPDLGRVHSMGEANPMNWTPEQRDLVSLDGYYIVEADYKAIELVVLAVLSRDPNLLKDLLQPDIHQNVGEDIFKTKTLTSDQRDATKAITYGTMYGAPESTVANQVNDARKQRAIAEGKDPDKIRKMSYAEAKRHQDAWYARYSEAAAYIDALGSATNEAVSYHGRIKKLPPVDSLDPEEREKQKGTRRRLAINSPIQNTASDLAKKGFVNVWEDPRINYMGAKIITTRHDSISLLVPDDVPREDIERILRENMEGIDENFPLKVDFKYGKSWGSLTKN